MSNRLVSFSKFGHRAINWVVDELVWLHVGSDGIEFPEVFEILLQIFELVQNRRFEPKLLIQEFIQDKIYVSQLIQTDMI